MESHIATRVLVLSDTHGDELQHHPSHPIDVLIHCGDLTEESKLEEIKQSIRLLKKFEAPLKLVIAGNHDFTMDIPMFKKKLADIQPPLEPALVKKTYGDSGEARELFEARDVKDAGIVFLDEGTHQFRLANGALLTVYASPYTPSLSDWGFQYHPQHEHTWAISGGTDVVVTHGPPKGLLDYTDSRQRAGSPSLFAAVARARPQMHCFGHIHEGWGAKLVTWRPEVSEQPSHFTDINNDESGMIQSLSGIRPRKFDVPGTINEKSKRLKTYSDVGCCTVDVPVSQRSQTLFVNAAIEGPADDKQQFPWLVTLKLPRAEEECLAGTTGT